MTKRNPPRLALALLERLVPGGTCMAGDLIEEYRRRPSRWRVWREVLAAIAIAWTERDEDIRPLRLVDLQPADAVERTRWFGRLRPVDVTASPIAGTSGFAVAVLALLTTLVMPGAWWLPAIGLIAGIVLGAVRIAATARTS